VTCTESSPRPTLEGAAAATPAAAAAAAAAVAVVESADAAAAEALPLSSLAAGLAVCTVSVVCGKPAGTYSPMPGERGNGWTDLKAGFPREK
jgi:hypothetical protein